MTFPHFAACGPPLNNSELDQAEAHLGFILPADLRQHLLKYNGGAPFPNCFPHDDDLFQVERFLSVKDGTAGLTIERVYALAGDAIPKDVVVFAYDRADNFYGYCIAGPNLHSICYLHHESYQDPDSYVTILAPSLQTFLEAFVPDPDEEDEYEDEAED